MSDLPKTDSREVARHAIAWEIAKKSITYTKEDLSSGEVAAEEYVKLFNVAYHGLRKKDEEE